MQLILETRTGELVVGFDVPTPLVPGMPLTKNQQACIMPLFTEPEVIVWGTRMFIKVARSDAADPLTYREGLAIVLLADCDIDEQEKFAAGLGSDPLAWKKRSHRA